ncbi:MAG: hypothetical protein ING08_09850 [Roseomonas sp.]|nr:hypothetical protein [Roseomonas sp.]MCA3380539.1 hypothetical protein [Roseomonas sp.]
MIFATLSARLRQGAILALPLLALVGCATPDPEPPVVASTTREMVAAVDRVDARNRTIVVRGPDNKPQTLQLGPEVRNFAQIRRGDRVRLHYEEAVAVRIAGRGSSLEPETVLGAARAEPGARPAVGAVAATRAQVRITALDTATNTVSFVGPSRVERTVAVRAPELREFLKTLNVGDRVDVAIAEAMAIRVEPAER